MDLKKDKGVVITLIIVVGVLLLAGMILGRVDAIFGTAKDTVSVTGQASMEVVPDRVGVYFNVQTSGKTSKEASDKNAEIVNEVRDALIRKGFAREDIQTQNFNVYRERDYQKNIWKDYTATHSLVVKFSTEDIDRIGEVVDAGLGEGATLNYVGFELSQELENEVRAEATKLAAEDAKSRAEGLAEGLDKKLGKLVSVSDNGYYGGPFVAYESYGASDSIAVKEAASNIVPSESEVSANVRVVYKLS